MAAGWEDEVDDERMVSKEHRQAWLLQVQCRGRGTDSGAAGSGAVRLQQQPCLRPAQRCLDPMPAPLLCQDYCDHGTLLDAIDRGWLRKRRALDGPLDVVALLQTALVSHWACDLCPASLQPP